MSITDKVILFLCISVTCIILYFSAKYEYNKFMAYQSIANLPDKLEGCRCGK